MTLMLTKVLLLVQDQRSARGVYRTIHMMLPVQTQKRTLSKDDCTSLVIGLLLTMSLF